MSLKITIFGLTLSSSWANGHATPYRAIIRALHRRGHLVTFFEKDVDYYERRRDFTEWPYCDLVLYSDWDNARTRALAQAAESDVAMVASYCPEGARIADEVLELARPLHVYYDLDTPITLSRLRHQDLDYLRRDQIPLFDLYLSFTGGKIIQQLQSAWGARKARPLYGCVDPDCYPRIVPHPDYQCDLSYMGTYARDRQQKLEAVFLAAAQRLPERSFVLAGSLYPWETRWPANVRRLDHVVPEEHSAFYSSSRATLNLTRGEMAEAGYCPSGRFFEAASCGTPILSDRWDGLQIFFTPGNEILLVETADDTVRALELADGELRVLAERARERTLDEHTGEHRAQQLLSYLEEVASATEGHAHSQQMYPRRAVVKSVEV